MCGSVFVKPDVKFVEKEQEVGFVWGKKTVIDKRRSSNIQQQKIEAVVKRITGSAGSA